MTPNVATVATPVPSPSAQPPRLLDVLRDTARCRGHSEITIGSFVAWARQFILFHNKRHPRELARAEVGQFLDHVVRTEKEPLAAVEMAGGRWSSFTATCCG